MMSVQCHVVCLSVLQIQCCVCPTDTVLCCLSVCPTDTVLCCLSVCPTDTVLCCLSLLQIQCCVVCLSYRYSVVLSVCLSYRYSIVLSVCLSYRYSVEANLVLDEVDKAEQEVQLFKLSGGGTICEQSVVGIRRGAGHSLEDLRHISMATGVRIVASTGFYSEPFLPPWVHQLSVQDLADFMIGELVKGAGPSAIKCGMMYIGCSYPLKEVEQRVLEAAAITHRHTGM